MSVVEYLQPDWGVPGVRYFRCSPMAATIAVDACAANWRASHAEGAERLHKCRICPVGAIHAGDTLASLSPMRGAKVCSRCGTGTTRLVHAWLCVSCYNREREWTIQRNAKGKRPTKMAPLHRRSMLLLEGDTVRIFGRDLTASTEELMVAALRDSDRAVQFAFNGRAAAQFSQGRLW